MSGGLMILLIIVVWLFVLAPLLLRGIKPMTKAGRAFDEPRVLFEGDSGDLAPRPRMRLRPEDIREHEEEDSYELVSADEEEESQLLIEEPVAEVVDGELVEEESAQDAKEEQDLVEDSDAEDRYEVHSSYIAPDDLLYRSGPSLEVVDELPARVEQQDEDEEEELQNAEFDDLTEEDLEYAKSRAGRGGWDVEQDRARSADRYVRRQRTLLILALACVLTVAVGIVLGGWTWTLAAVAGILTVAYLVALRTQVMQERALRARRLRHLRRARLGVRNREAEEMRVPQQLRRHGATVMELDDESPDFHYLPETTYVQPELHPVPPRDSGRRRVS